MKTHPDVPNPTNFRCYLREKAYFIIIFIACLVFLLLFLFALKATNAIILTTSIFFISFAIIVLMVDYLRRRNFYRKLLHNISELDQAYLVLETLERPNFYDGAVIYDALYSINKSMAERVQIYNTETREFRDYIEMWIHEVKTPLAALMLMNRDRKMSAELNRLDNYLEQILYLSRAENAEHDYYVKSAPLARVVHAVIAKNQDLLLAHDIRLNVDALDCQVYTDPKWLEFILNQIIRNSIKYHSKAIQISAQQTPRSGGARQTTLTITDDGIGIAAKDLPRVFEKSFTGENGHQNRGNYQRSTGMGLYIAKTLCDKLGHQITVASPQQQGTIVEIAFASHDYYTTLPNHQITQHEDPNLTKK